MSGCVNLKPKPDRTQLYVLGANAVSGETVSSMPEIDELYVSRPNMPQFLAQTKHLIYLNESGEMRSLKRSRWGEAIEEGLARAIAEAINQRLGEPVARFYPWPEPRSASRLTVELFRMDFAENGHLSAELTWSLSAFGSSEIEKSARLKTEIPWDRQRPETYVAAYDQLIEKLADQFVIELSSQR